MALGGPAQAPSGSREGAHGDIPGQDTAGGLCSLWLTVPSIWPPLALTLGLAVGMGLWGGGRSCSSRLWSLGTRGCVPGDTLPVSRKPPAQFFEGRPSRLLNLCLAGQGPVS